MKFSKLTKVAVVVLVAFSAAGCSTWDSMTSRQKGAVTGAGIGGVAAAAITGGSVLGTVGGAAIGGVVGDQIGKQRN